MASKVKLKRKLRKQKTKHRLEVSDLHIALDAATYNLLQEETRRNRIQEDMDRLLDELYAAGIEVHGGKLYMREQAVPSKEMQDTLESMELNQETNNVESK